MFGRLRDLIARVCQPYGTSHTPASFGLDGSAFFLAVLRAAPANSTLHLDQCEDEKWVRSLRDWAHRTSRDQFEADYYRVDDRFIQVVAQLLTEDPSSMDCLHHIAVKSADGRCLMASVDNLSIITDLDESIRKRLVGDTSQARRRR